MKKWMAFVLSAALLLSGCGAKCADSYAPIYNAMQFGSEQTDWIDWDENDQLDGAPAGSGLFSAEASDALTGASDELFGSDRSQEKQAESAEDTYSVTLSSYTASYDQPQVLLSAQRVEVSSTAYPAAALAIQEFWEAYAELPLSKTYSAQLDSYQWLYVLRLDPMVLSFRTYETELLADSESVSYRYGGVNFDPTSGEPLYLEDILENGGYDSLVRVLAARVDESGAAAELEQYLSGCEQRLWDREGSTCWCLTEDGMTFYLEDRPTVNLHYGELYGILLPAYFPEEADLGAADLTVDTSGSDLPTREIVLDPEGERYYLRSDSGLRDLRIELGSDLYGGNSFLLRQIYAADRLLPTEQLCIVVSEWQANLCVRYNGGPLQVLELPES